MWQFYSNKKVDKFQLCLNTAASLFPFSCVTLLVTKDNGNVGFAKSQGTKNERN
jgi:hypothetical protein